MNRRTILGILVALVLLPSLARAQYSDYDWAKALQKEFGFEDVAEQILKDMVAGQGRTPLEMQQGKLGLAELKASQARKQGALSQRLDLYKNACDLMREVVKKWPNKTSKEYYAALFSLVAVLQQRGESAQNAITAGRVPDNQKSELQKGAEVDFGRAEQYLLKVRDRFEKATSEKDREGWRLKNRAWYLQCVMAYNKAMVMKGTRRGMALLDGMSMLEEFVLANETDDSEAMLGALYGYLLMGRVAEAQGEGDTAVGQWLSILDQIPWQSKLPPSWQSLVEKTWWELGKYHNAHQEYEKAVKVSEELEANYKRLGMRFNLVGRAARVELAKAFFKLGRSDQALAIVSEVARTGRSDASAGLANKLVASIIAATSDKTRFSPAVILSAARGAWRQGSSHRAEAVAYYEILLQVADQIKDKSLRGKAEAEAWYKRASFAYNQDRVLEAALICREGAKRCYEVPERGAQLVHYWSSWLKAVDRQTDSAQVHKLITECRDWRLANGSRIKGITKSAGDLLYDQAYDLEQEARKLAARKKIAQAIGKYKEAASNYRKSSEKGGKNQDRARSKQARCGLKVAKLLFRQGKSDEALPLFKQAKKDFYTFLTFIKDPKNATTDPQRLGARNLARAEARYSIAECNENMLRDLLKDEQDKTRLMTLGKPLNRETVQVLTGFQKDHKGNQDLAMFALKSLLKAHLALGHQDAARKTFLDMRTLGPDHRWTTWAGARVANAMRAPAAARFKQIAGKIKPSDEIAWEKIRQKPGFAEVRKQLMESNNLYRDWLLNSKKAQKTFDNWRLIAGYYWNIAAWDKAAEILRKGLDRFDGTNRADAKSLRFMKYKLLVAHVNLAKRADQGQDQDRALRSWGEAARMADEVLNFKKKIHYQEVLRLAAFSYGGYLEKRTGGLITFHPASGEFGKAHGLWRKLLERARQKDVGGNAYFEAYFYVLHAAYLKNKSSGSSNKNVKQSLKILRVQTAGKFGGPHWRSAFQWLEQQVN